MVGYFDSEVASIIDDRHRYLLVNISKFLRNYMGNHRRLFPKSE